MANDDKSLSKEAEDVGKAFVAILGLPDLIVGGVGLYSAWTWPNMQAQLVQEFPSTRVPFIDIALLACAAAFVGKLILLAAAFLMALIQVLLLSKHANEVRGLLQSRCGVSAKASDPYDLATMILGTNAQRFEQIEKKRQSAIFTTAAALVSLLYVPSMLDLYGRFGVGAPIALGLLALLLQVDHKTTVRDYLLCMRRGPEGQSDG